MAFDLLLPNSVRKFSLSLRTLEQKHAYETSSIIILQLLIKIIFSVSDSGILGKKV